ncbi:substrate-binding periplasmic protein [Granulosicoccus antarcticus]|nr:transporter substrate-binding domain-containing protein [Granulosicoccus antarcticus]
MKSFQLTGRCRAMLALCFSCYVLPASADVIAEPVVESWVLSTETLPPLITKTGDGYLDILYDEWFARAGLNVEFIATPAARGLANANAGLIDGEAARIDIPLSNYPNLRKVSEVVTQLVFTGFTLDPDVSVISVADFDQYSVGYVRGWKLAEKLFGKHANAVPVRKIDSLLEMLLSKRIDIAFLMVSPTLMMARDKGLEQLITTKYSVTKEFYLYVNSKHYKKIPELERTLREMKSDGSYQMIMADYIAENQ